LVDLTPVDGGVSDFVVDDELVAGASAGACAGGCDQGSVGGEAAFSPEKRGLDELRNSKIQMHLWAIGERLESLGGGRVCHPQRIAKNSCHLSVFSCQKQVPVVSFQGSETQKERGIDERFNRRGALHRVKGGSGGCKQGLMAASMVALRRDTYRAGSPSICFRL